MPGYSMQGGGNYQYLIRFGAPLIFDWAVNVQDYKTFTDTIEGKLNVVLSENTIFEKSDQLLLERSGNFKNYDYQKDTLDHLPKPGEYFLLASFISKDSLNYDDRSELLIQRLMVYDLKVNVERAYITDFELSEYHRNTELKVALSLDVPCCTDSLGSFNFSLEVLGRRNELPTDDGVQINTFYENRDLEDGVNLIELEADLYNFTNPGDYKFFGFNVSGYFTHFYSKIEEILPSVPLEVITDVAAVNAMRQEQHPFLTYGDFSVSSDQLEGLEVDVLVSQARQFYSTVEQSLRAAQAKDYKTYLELADSAFAHCGRHAPSSLLFIQPGVVSSLYSSFHNILVKDSSFQEPYTNSAIQFRLGEAMDMESLMDGAYKRLSEEILPGGIAVKSAVEASGYFDTDSTYLQPVLIENPVLWKEVTVLALEHFVRVHDFESADQLIGQADRHAELLIPVWMALESMGGDSLFGDLASELIDYNSMLDYHLAKLNFYTTTGLFDEGKRAFERTNLLYQNSFKFDPSNFWLTSAAFFEELRAFERADSLYMLADRYFEKRADDYSTKSDKSKIKLRGFNQVALERKIKPIEGNTKLIRDYVKNLENVKKQGFVLDYLDIMNNRSTSQKLGLFRSAGYPEMYMYNINQLEDQNQYFLASDWRKDFAYFLGRDKHYSPAFVVYHNLFGVENLKSKAFRSSFSEEAQVFYGRKQLEVFNRFINLVLEAPADSLTQQEAEEALTLGFNQTMFYHSFILRGNMRLLYDIFQSDDPVIQQKYELWKAYKELLNDLYIKENTTQTDINKLKKEIEQTGEALIRNVRDTSTFFTKEVSEFEQIRSRLKEGEAAIEIIRIMMNHEVYYGDEIRYAAYIITRDMELPKLIAWPTSSVDLENRDFKYYRSAIQFQLTDTLSYNNYWKPIEDNLPDSIQTIYFSPDGIYQLINPQTLLNPSSGNYLIDEVDIRFVPTISSISPDEKSELKSATLFGDPIYIDNPSTPDTTRIATNRSSLLSNEIYGLPGTKAEVEQINDILVDHAFSVSIFTGNDVNKKNIYANNQSDIIHLATHGYWIDESGISSYSSLYRSLSKSGVILAKAQQRTNKGDFNLIADGLLTAAEIQDMNLFQTELVVLSACETGLGEVVPGEGVFGLKRAFQKAGTRNLVTSLWKVDDTASQRFMTLFYKNMMDSKIEIAFAKAGRELKKEYSAPYYWGAFTLTKFH